MKPENEPNKQESAVKVAAAKVARAHDARIKTLTALHADPGNPVLDRADCEAYAAIQAAELEAQKASEAVSNG